MKCCSKAGVGLAVLAGLGIAAIAATGVGPAMWERAKTKFERQVPPEVQVEQLKIDISKLNKDMDKNWTLIAKYEFDVKDLEKELARKQSKVKSMEKELAAAADELDAQAKFVRYEGKEYSRRDAERLLQKETTYFTALKREVESKERLLDARKVKLEKAMTNQKSIAAQQQELIAQVGLLEADLETLKLMRTESKLPDGENSRLDKIKHRLNKLQTQVEIENRAHELREANNGGSVSDAISPKVDHKDTVKMIREALGSQNLAKDGE